VHAVSVCRRSGTPILATLLLVYLLGRLLLVPIQAVGLLVSYKSYLTCCTRAAR